jgi:hypothetical protein
VAPDDAQAAVGPKENHFMRLLSPGLAVSLLAAIPFGAAATHGEERGEWVAQVNLTTKQMFVTDCPCESGGESVTMTCEPFGGTAHVVLPEFWSKDGKAGDKGEATFDVDGKAAKQSVSLEAYNEGTVPAFDMPIPAFDSTLGEFVGMPLLESIAWGRVLKLGYGGKTVSSPLKGSREAMRDMITYCRAK